MLFKNITILDENFEIKENMYLGVEGAFIEYIGTEMPQKDFGRVYDGKGKLLMSAFYNSHGHSPMALMRGYGENLALQDWLNQRIFPFEDKLDSKAVYWGTLLTMAESMRFGIVSTSDMYYFIDDMVKATVDAGMKANISRAIVHFGDSDPWEMPSMQEMKRTFEAYHNMEDGRIKMDVSIHGEYTSGPAAVKAVVDYGKSVGANMHVHLSETKLEHEECKERRNGMTPAQYFNSLGVFDMPATAAHCVWIEGEDFDILKEKNVTVASNPVSNLKLASGVCNVPELLRRGVNVALGTDSVASNNSLNFFEEMKVFAMASKMMFADPTVVTPVETLRAATVNGALGQGRKDCGLVKEGFRADLIVVDIDQPNMHPVHNMANNLVYSASGTDVIMTMSDGKVIYEDGEYKTIDIEKTIFEAGLSTKEILAKL
ncbi:MAG: amidohydrolase [Firmicutes bacterium]|nr:amidohydrolase [Bacillota bacterium]